MRSVKTILTDKKNTQEIKGMVQAYEEIAASKIQLVRTSILDSRDYFESLTRLSNEVGTDLEKVGLGAIGEAFVFIASQTGLYGDIVDKVFVSFLSFISKKNGGDVYVLGKLGQTLMNSFAPKVHYEYMDLKDDGLEEQDLAIITKKLLRYKKINIFCGKFKNIVNQESWTRSISGQVLGDIQDKELDVEKFAYLYEPDVSQVAKVFSEEISALLFNDSLEESKLAKLGSRLMYLDESLEKIDKKLDKIILERVKAIRRRNEKKQLTSFAGIKNF